MFVSVITSGHLSEASITSSVMGAGTIPIKEHNVLKILMRTDYRFASDQSGYIINVFGFDKEWERPDNFIMIEALYFLTLNRKKRGQIGLEGYFTCRSIADALQRYGYVPEDVLGALNHLLRKQLITADHMNRSAVSFDDSVHILAAGFMHLRVLPERLEYLYGILPTVPLADQAVAHRIAEVLGAESNAGDLPGSTKARAVRLLHQYLVKQEGQLRQRDVHTNGGKSGAVYVLAKVSSALQHFFSRHGVVSEEQDILDT